SPAGRRDRRDRWTRFRVGGQASNNDDPHSLRRRRRPGQREAKAQSASNEARATANAPFSGRFENQLVDFLVRSASASARRPASVMRTRATSIILPPATIRSVVAFANPALISSTIGSMEKRGTSITASVQPSRDAASRRSAPFSPPSP